MLDNIVVKAASREPASILLLGSALVGIRVWASTEHCILSKGLRLQYQKVFSFWAERACTFGLVHPGIGVKLARGGG